MPDYLDPRLRYISITHVGLNSHKRSTELPAVESLNLSYNAITQLSEIAFSLRTLRSLDLSHNRLTTITFSHLPNAGMLDKLYLSNNPIASYGALAFNAAMGRCLAPEAAPGVDGDQEAGVSADTAIAALGMTLDVPGCSLKLVSGTSSETSAQVSCVVVSCDAGLQPAVLETCPDGGHIEGQDSLFLEQYCDGLVQCKSKSDEMSCGGLLLVESTNGTDDVGLCSAFGGYFTTYSVRYGVATFQVGAAAESGFTPNFRKSFVFALDASQGSISFDADGFVRGTMKTTFEGPRAMMAANYTTSTLPGQLFGCRVTYKLASSLSDDDDDATTPGPYVGARGSGSAPLLSADATPAVAGCLAGVVVLGVAAFVLFRKRRMSAHRRRLDLLAPPTPAFIIQQVGDRDGRRLPFLPWSLDMSKAEESRAQAGTSWVGPSHPCVSLYFRCRSSFLCSSLASWRGLHWAPLTGIMPIAIVLCRSMTLR
jgi:hypothetical protein